MRRLRIRDLNNTRAGIAASPSSLLVRHETPGQGTWAMDLSAIEATWSSDSLEMSGNGSLGRLLSCNSRLKGLVDR